jgi:multiple sugar transport system permease protein
MSRRRSGSNAVAYVVLGVGGLLMVSPFLYQISASLMTNAEVTAIPKRLLPATFHWENYPEALAAFPFWDQLRNTVLFTVIQTVCQVLFASMAGYAFARLRFAGAKPIFAILLSILMIPAELLLISQYQIVQSLGLLNTIAGLVAPGVVTVFGTFMLRQFFLGLPRELSDAATIDGAGPVTTFLRIMLPLAAPGVSALAIITVISSWGAFLWPLIVATYSEDMTLAVGIASFAGEHETNYPQTMATSLVVMLPVMIFFVALQRRVIAGLAFSGIRG